MERKQIMSEGRCMELRKQMDDTGKDMDEDLARQHRKEMQEEQENNGSRMDEKWIKNRRVNDRKWMRNGSRAAE